LKNRLTCWGHYALASTLSGTLTGFIYASLIFVLFSWVPHFVKIFFFSVIVGLYLLSELKIIQLKIPQRKWQIPISWVKGSTKRNMWIWGVILGAGIFTYMPYVTFYLLYIYIGLFKEPSSGMLYGMFYGFFRAMPSILLCIKRSELDMVNLQKLYKKKDGLFKLTNVFSLLFLFVFITLKAVESI